MTPYQNLVASLAVSGITDEETILATAVLRNVEVDAPVVEVPVDAPVVEVPVDAPVVEVTKAE